MSINDLPDDCLLAIFDYINYLGDLTDCFKVCNKWSYLIAERTKKVKYLMAIRSDSNDSVYFTGLKPIDGSCLKTLFSNLLIAQLSEELLKKVSRKDVVAFLENQKSLKGLILSDHITSYLNFFDIEMICSNCLGGHDTIKLKRFNVKQIHTMLDLLRNLHKYNFSNLERLSITNYGCAKWYIGPVLAKLKIFECTQPFNDLSGIHQSFHFIDSCPNLQSAYIVVNRDRYFVNESLEHQFLQDLVIYFKDIARIDWNQLKRVILKYPKLKHLALRAKLTRKNGNIEGSVDMENEWIEQLVHILPNLVLLDVRGCRGVTQTADDYVQHYCKRYGRSIKFYFNENRHEIESDWPHLSTKMEKISRGFDFMKNCFLKRPHELPCFLIPIDY
ncbi:uncharacterized protein LOC107361614 isoform X2 [Tetranychus urticae]|uniref:uncharacterized protein LOC107361614 isoform X2 n=1 Tax=Tetranychus urticae TaxID=32264 RepID=UPI000D65E452|nr:uncharacterized protein LOC107361614 isoform X2 [Tetranychus urticae]